MGKSKNHILIVLIILWIPLLVLELVPSKKHEYRWVFVYYIPYDNDLCFYGNQILGEMADGISNDEIAVVTQIDFPDDRGMKRVTEYYSDGKTKRKEKYLSSDDSADTNELKKFFNWVRDKWKAENYCVVFTDHGGLLNSMCLDEKPFRKLKNNKKYPSGKWFPADQVGKILADFNHSVDGKVRLLFLQQCGRAAIQNLYSFTDTSEYLLASPVIVGALNTYYTQTLKAATNEPEITGKALAETIMREDESYNIYTLIKTDKLKEIPEKLTPVLDVFLQAESLESAKAGRPMFEYEGDNFYDFQTYMKALSSANDSIGNNEIETFFDWCDTELVENVSFKDYDPNNEYFKPIDESWRCGLSIYIPSTKDQLGRYDYLPLYKQTNLEDFMRLMFQ